MLTCLVGLLEGGEIPLLKLMRISSNCEFERKVKRLLDEELKNTDAQDN